MAGVNSKLEQHMKGSEEEKRLKYLEFVHAAAVQAIVCFSNLYCYAKDKAGPLKPGVETVEGTVKTVVGPVYDRFHDVPLELLKFVDRKVDESVTKIDHRVPPMVKQVSFQAYDAAQKAPEVARSVASEVHRSGVVPTTKSVYSKYEPTAKKLYFKYEPVAEQYAVSAWRYLNSLPLFPQAAQVLVPTAAFCSDKYNQTVKTGAMKGYRIAYYMPTVPTERIAKVFAEREREEETTQRVVLGNANGPVAVGH